MCMPVIPGLETGGWESESHPWLYSKFQANGLHESLSQRAGEEERKKRTKGGREGKMQNDAVLKNGKQRMLLCTLLKQGLWTILRVVSFMEFMSSIITHDATKI